MPLQSRNGVSLFIYDNTLGSGALKKQEWNEEEGAYGNHSGKMWTNLDQNGCRMYLATREWSTLLYLYRRSVATPC
jgi:hypothetical protein